MVYNGPSTGCGTCRKRKVKGRPGCNNCAKRKQQCPGYQNAFDTHHRSETASTIKRLGSRSDSDASSLSPSSRASTSSPSSSTSLVHFKDASRDTCFVMNEWWSSSPLRTNLTLDPEILSIGFLFDNFNRRDVEPEAVHGMMTHLTPIYAAAPTTSPVKCATAAIALNLYMLFRDYGSDTKLARASYASAVSKVKRDLLDPTKASSDELMVAIFLLDFYEMLNARFFPNGVPPNDHKNGMMALVKHRGNSILESPTSRIVATCVRNCLAEWAIDGDIELPYEGLGWVEDESLSQSAAARLDLLSLKIVQYRSKVRRLEEVSRKKGRDVIQSEVATLLTEAAQLDDDMRHWIDTLPPSWDRLYVQAEDLPPTIVAAGVYGDRCSVFTDLSVCDTWCEHRLRWVLLLRVIQQCASHSLDLSIGKALIASLNQRIQALVDDLLETVPLFIGDCTVDVSYAERHSLQYPQAVHENGNVYPNPLIDHTKAAVSWGGWSIYSLLLNILKMASPKGGPFPITLRPGQIAWIFGQVGRLQAAYTFMSILA